MKDLIGISFEKVILKCYNKDRPKGFIPIIDEEEEWIKAIWKLLPVYNVFIYSYKKKPENIKKWFKENVAFGGYPFKVEIIAVEKGKLWANLTVGITDKKLKAIVLLGDTIKFHNWEDAMRRLYAIY